MSKIVLCSPNLKSRALKALANKLSEKVGYRVYRVLPTRVRNRRAIKFLTGIDKVGQFRAFNSMGVSAPLFTTNRVDIDGWPSNRIVARTLTNSSEGRGIVIFNKGDPVPNAPLYTEYIPKKREFRVHVWDNKVIDIQEKRKRRGVNERDTQIRNTANGYVFCRSDIAVPSDCGDLALAAVAALGRTYGAVDIIWQEKTNRCFVLEVNSRPGMEGTTVEKYANAILESLR